MSVRCVLVSGSGCVWVGLDAVCGCVGVCCCVCVCV